MITSYLRQFIVLCGLGVLAACSSPVAPSGDDVAGSLRNATEDAVRSAAGPWYGVVSGNSIQFEFSLTQAADGRLQGTGTMTEASAVVPITISGTYNRPNISLTFTGMVVDKREVTGTFVEVYDSFAGVSGTLRLTADNYARSLSLLLQEGPPPPSTLGGRVTDAVTGAPVADASVNAQGTSVSSSVTGHYAFTRLNAGRFTVTVSHPLYRDATRDVDIAPYKTEDFKLQPK